MKDDNHFCRIYTLQISHGAPHFRWDRTLRKLLWIGVLYSMQMPVFWIVQCIASLIILQSLRWYVRGRNKTKNHKAIKRKKTAIIQLIFFEISSWNPILLLFFRSYCGSANMCKFSRRFQASRASMISIRRRSLLFFFSVVRCVNLF